MPTESGQDVYWTKQGANVVVENCVPDAQNALLDLGKWFKEKTGKMLVCTAGTNGSHAGGQYSHANGYKLDVNDWYGPEGLEGEYFGYPLDSNGTQLLADFVSYGHSLGLGMSIEGDHVDVQTTGFEWTTNTNYGGYGNPNGNNVQMHGGGGGSFAQTPYAGKKMDSARTHGFKDDGSSVTITPEGKTYCEPVYPDYIYVTGNIPNSSVEQTVMSSKEGLAQVNGDTELMTAQTMQDLTGLDINAFTTSDAQAFAQRLFDPKDSIMEFKVPNAGKPLNNNDPYPVDLKIEELENHMPRVKQYTLPYNRECGVSKTISKAILSLSDYTEKRLVKIENTLSTIMRYIFGVGSRMFVNCQYYGGQDHRSKYVCIRCLRDDRCGDGQVMQLDQCLSCSRYEPIIGQTYDILNEVGANLAAIQDDVQAGYMNMEEYINWVRVEQMHTMRDDIELDYKNTKTRNKDEKDFKDLWDEGVKMNWKLTPVEQQKPQVNWRQDINSADQSPEKLTSYQQSNGLGGSGLNPTSTVDKGKDSKNADKDQADMDSIANGEKNGEDPEKKPNDAPDGGNTEGQSGQENSQEIKNAKEKLKQLKAEADKIEEESRGMLKVIDSYHDHWLGAMRSDPSLANQKTFSLEDIRAYGQNYYSSEFPTYCDTCNKIAACGTKTIELYDQMQEIEDKYKLNRYTV